MSSSAMQTCRRSQGDNNTSPLWSGLMNDGRAYAPYTYNYDKLVPWRTLTGRQHFYLDQDMYIAYGENLPTYKPAPKPELYGDLKETLKEGKALILNYLTPHGKWHIHSTYMENLRMLTLSRGCEPCWMSEVDAEKLGIKDNDWVEVYNDHGVYCTRAVVSARIPRGVCIVYHVPERTTGIPKSQVRGNRRAGGHNSVTRIHLKPNYLCWRIWSIQLSLQLLGTNRAEQGYARDREKDGQGSLVTLQQD